jgi:hypothetical protein
MKLERYGVWVLLALTALVYAPLYKAGFVWDDSALVLDNALTGDLWGNLGAMFSTDLWRTLKLAGADSGYYRPLMLLSLAVDRALFGLSGPAHHIHNIIWHVLCVWGVFAVIKRLSGTLPAIGGAALFAFHPVQIEAVALIASRNDAMAMSLCIGALLLLWDETPKPWKLALASFSLLCGLLSKESAILAPLMLGCLDLVRFGKPRGWARYVALVVGAVVYLAMRQAAGIGSAAFPDADSWGLLFERLHTVLGIYGSLLVWPWPLTPARHILWLPEVQWPFWVGGAFSLTLMGYGFFRAKNRKLVLAGLAWAALSFAPTLIATVDKGLMGERYLYFPMAGLALALVGVVGSEVKVWKALALLLVPSLIAIELRLPDWQGSRVLWQAAHDAEPTAFTAGGLGWYVYDDGDYEESQPLFIQAIEGDPPYRDACTHLLMVHIAVDDPEGAVEMGSWAMKERGCPPIPETLGNYGLALASLGRWSEATPVVSNLSRDPFQHGLLVMAANEARLRRYPGYLALQPYWQGGGMEDKVYKLLRLSGEGEAALDLEGWLIAQNALQLASQGQWDAALARTQDMQTNGRDPGQQALLVLASHALRERDIERFQQLAGFWKAEVPLASEAARLLRTSGDEPSAQLAEALAAGQVTLVTDPAELERLKAEGAQVIE